MSRELSRMRVLVSGRVPESVLEELERTGFQLVAWSGRKPAPREFLEANIAEAQGLLCLLTDQVGADLLSRAPDLRVVSNYAVGYDNIDVGACTEAGVVVTNTPGVLTEATADLAFALLLASARRVVEADRLVRDGGWETWEVDFMVGRGVHGKTLGILGFGAIGQAVARRARGFDMEILFSDPGDRSREAGDLRAEPVSMEELLGRSDYISVHVPLTGKTRGLLAAQELAGAKEGSILINTSRGEVVDEAALQDALAEGPLAAAGLDVFATEPLPPDHPLTSLDNVVLAPHIGSATRQARLDMGMLAVENLVRVLSGQRPPHPVNPEVLER